MPTIPKCLRCGSDRLLEVKMAEGWFRVPEPVFKFTVADTPNVYLEGVATACLDCGTVIAQTNPLHFQKTAAKWMTDKAKKQALRLE